MSSPTIWWVLAGVAVALEMVSGTFYLLMLGLGLASGAVAAHLGATFTGQMVAAAVVGGGAVAVWHAVRRKQPRSERASANKDVNLDIGAVVEIAAWREDGLATVRYRGADWTAQSAGGSPRQTGSHHVVEVVGSRLIVKPVHS